MKKFNSKTNKNKSLTFSIQFEEHPSEFKNLTQITKFTHGDLKQFEQIHNPINPNYPLRDLTQTYNPQTKTLTIYYHNTQYYPQLTHFEITQSILTFIHFED